MDIKHIQFEEVMKQLDKSDLTQTQRLFVCAVDKLDRASKKYIRSVEIIKEMDDARAKRSK